MYVLIPNITGRMLQSDSEQALFALPARLGGLAFTNPVEVAQIEYSHPLLANKQLAVSIVNQHVRHILRVDSSVSQTTPGMRRYKLTSKTSSHP